MYFPIILRTAYSWGPVRREVPRFIVRKSSEDQRATDTISEETKHLIPGFEIPQQWKEGEPNLGNNRSYAIHRLNSLFPKFKKEPGYQEEYHQANKNI